MKDARLEAAMPEVVIYIKALMLGFVISEIFRIASQLAEPLANQLGKFRDSWTVGLIAVFVVLVSVYAVSRGAKKSVVRLSRSLRFDLLFTICVGVICDHYLVESKVETYLKVLNSQTLGWGWAAAVLFLCALLMISSIVGFFCIGLQRKNSKIYFLTDKEIVDSGQDCLCLEDDVRTFAETVLASNVESGLVIGLEGPWGVGKTSFLKMAEAYWSAKASPSVIFFRFEPLRYAGEPDLTERFVKELLRVVQSAVFAPEFKVALSRYSKILKGKAEFSFFGLKMSFEPSNETVDELLKDLDLVLRRIDRRLIVVVDDLDRIEPKAVSNVLFTVRRTFNLSRATYILCYDTENLIAGKDEGKVSREFLEKFINVKFSMFIDSDSVLGYLKGGWERESEFYNSLSLNRRVVLTALLLDLACLLEGKHTVQYMRLVGNLRKIKRFINAIVAMQLEKLDISITDFNRGDIINLVLLYMNYPGVFRRIYSEETEGRSGIFSTVVSEDNRLGNVQEYLQFVLDQDDCAAFLLESLFSMQVRRAEGYARTRAFVNDRDIRPLEKYLQLIVRRTVPAPAGTFKLYQDAVSKAASGDDIENILLGRGFELHNGEQAHKKFWSMFVDQCGRDEGRAAEVVGVIVNILPRYMLLRVASDNLREGLILDIVRLLEAVGWGGNRSESLDGSLAVANQIFGQRQYSGRGVIDGLLGAEREVVKWHDVLMFRQFCSLEKNNRFHQVCRSLWEHQGDCGSGASGAIPKDAQECLRIFSQHIFRSFDAEFIQLKENFFQRVRQLPSQCFLGELSEDDVADISGLSVQALNEKIEIERHSLISLVVFNLANVFPSDDQPRGCGFYDAEGSADDHEIASKMNEYLFGVCFDVSLDEENLLHFLDFCIANFSCRSIESENPELAGVESNSLLSANEVILSLDYSRLKSYWLQHRERVLSVRYLGMDRRVCTRDCIKYYKYDLQNTCNALDVL